MKTPAIEPLTDGEERIMQMLWSLGEGTVNDILAVIPEPKPKYTTVATFIKILENKGYVAHRSEGKSYVFTPRGRRQADAVDVAHLFRRIVRADGHLLLETREHLDEGDGRDPLRHATDPQKTLTP